jgi:3-hydroxyisobutyrate dehydrogenase-like beta-hydroxyacid dehydrogenase
MSGNPFFVLTKFIDAILPVQIAKYRRQGGPTQADYDRLEQYIETIGSQADNLMGGAEPGMPGKVAGQMVDALAIASFAEGGVLHESKSAQIRRWLDGLREVKS